MTNLSTKMYVKVVSKLQGLAEDLKNQRGEMNVIAVVLLIVVAVALIVIFWDFIQDFIKGLIEKISGSADSVGTTSGG